MADVSVKMGVSGISEFKQGMTNAAASVKTLDAALKANEKQFERTGNAEEHYAAQATLLNQKLKQQQEFIRNAEKALKQMEDNGVNKNSAAYQNMQRQLIEANSAMSDTEEQLRNLGNTTQNTTQKTDQLASSLQGLNKKVSLEQVKEAVGSITEGLENAGKKAVELGQQLWDQVMDSARRADDTATMAQMYGIDLDRFQRMQKLVGNGLDTSVDAMLSSQDKLKKGIGSGNSQVLNYMEQLGISVRELSGDEGVGEFITRDQTELFWEAGKALMNMSDAYDKEAAATAMFGRSWKELVPLFETYDSLEEYEAALDAQTVTSEKAVRDLADLNDAVSKLESNWTILKDEMLGAIAPALTKGADALSGLLEKLTLYLQSERGQEMLENLGKAVEGLFKDISEIDPQQVIEGFSGVFTAITDGFKWISDNSGTIVSALEAVVIGWGALKLTGGALELLTLIQGITGLGGAGASTAAATAGASAGASWGSAFAAAVVKAAPWLIGLYTALKPGETAGTDESEIINEATGQLTTAGWNAWVNNPELFADVIETVGEEFGDLGAILQDASAITSMVKFWSSGDLDQLRRELMDLGYVLKTPEQERKTNIEQVETEGGTAQYDSSGERIGYTPEAGKGRSYRKNRRTGEIIWNDEEPMTVEAEPELTPDAQSDLQGLLDNMDLSAVVELRPSMMRIGAIFGGLDFLPHANGLPLVPFDGYPALLHKNEQVIPARQVERENRSYNSNLYVESMYMSGGADAEGLAAAMAAAQRRTSAGFGS